MHTLSLSLSLALLIFLSALCNINATATKKLPKGFSIDLIHRDSPLSPLYNSSMTHLERLQNAALRSISRANRFGQSSSMADLVETDLSPNDANYLMKISVGTPAVERWAVADTGSDLIWFQCSPCPQCYPQNAQLFNPKSSSTYISLLCSSDQCKSLPQVSVQSQTYPNCGTSNECTYFYSYGDKSYTIGELATESLGFGQAVSFPKTVFGCGHNNNLVFYENAAGLVGLGQGALSLVSQMGNVGRKFSYCLPPFSHQQTTTTKLRFGDEATISGNGLVSTQLITRSDSPTFYYLNLEGITVGQQKVPLTSQSNGNILIDSGTTLTMLPSSFYEQVEVLLKQAIGADQLIVQNNQYKLCYRNANSIQKVPNFEVHFTGANLSLNRQNIFRFISDDVMCLAILPTDGMSIYGNVAHIDFEVEYELDQKKISFAPVDCTKQ